MIVNQSIDSAANASREKHVVKKRALLSHGVPNLAYDSNLAWSVRLTRSSFASLDRMI
jgi:hypothetical protein